jgi:threonine/homoserine/homoserine lactone efflux protein
VFLQLGAIFLTALLVGFSGALMPGPVFAITVKESPRRGARTGPLIVLGHALAEATLVILLAFGLSHLFQKRSVVGVVGLLGGLMLLWMGGGMAYDVLRKKISLQASGERVLSRFGPVVTGLLLTVAGPYWLLWWATVGAGYVIFSLKFGLLGLLFFYSGHILSDLVWYSAVALAAASGGKLMNDGVYRGLVLACGAFLILLSAYFFATGVRMLRG